MLALAISYSAASSMIGPREVSLIASAQAIRTGLNTMISSSEPTRSNVRLSA